MSRQCCGGSFDPTSTLSPFAVADYLLGARVEGTSKNRYYSHDGTKLPANDSLRSHSDSLTFTPRWHAIGIENNFSR